MRAQQANSASLGALCGCAGGLGLALGTLLLTGCAGQFSFGGGPMYSAGDVGGSHDSAVGAGVEAAYVGMREGGVIGGMLSANVGGNSVTGDGDGLIWAEFTGLYRRYFGSPGTIQPFVTGGAGLGVERYSGLLASAFAEAGLQWRPARTFGLSVGARERPLLASGRINNAVQLALTVDFIHSRVR